MFDDFKLIQCVNLGTIPRFVNRSASLRTRWIRCGEDGPNR